MPRPSLPRYVPAGPSRLPKPQHAQPPPPAPALLFNHEPEPLRLSRPHLYRAYLQHIRFIPDPHIWLMMIPRMKELCRHREALDETSDGYSSLVKPDVNDNDADDLPMGVVSFELERIRTLKRARKELAGMRAAVACHPHALQRLIERAYGQRGRIRRDLITRICETSPPPAPHPAAYLLGSGRPDLPPPLQATRPAPVPPQPASPRARQYVPKKAGKRKAVANWARDWDRVLVPLVLPQWLPRGQPSAMTGWEGCGVVESLRVLTGDDTGQVENGAQPLPLPSPTPTPSSSPSRYPIPDPRKLSTFLSLPANLQRLFPVNLPASTRDLERYGVPRRRETRANPSTWRGPRPLTLRLLQRIYRRFWDTLVWVRPADSGAWVRCSFHEMAAWEKGTELQDIPTMAGLKKRRKKGPMAVPFEQARFAHATEDEARWLEPAQAGSTLGNSPAPTSPINDTSTSPTSDKSIRTAKQTPISPAS
ncbi:hypothetical protein BCR39DRAFT_385607 [Naematelia encephala]|uniref:Uncharacterized protein n=1 Tax=Naematelia encephala TaxID=71784 RepID=A0A1Y2AJ97_9TREE|nr:hypothetical protein BCR39DRAFT_385607 [Naematelia encephala]